MYKTNDWYKFAENNIYFDEKQQGKYNYSNLVYILLGKIYNLATKVNINEIFKKAFSWNKDKKGNYDTAGGIKIQPKRLLDLCIIISGMMTKKQEEMLKEQIGENGLNTLKINEEILDKMIKNNYGIKKVKDDFYEFQDGFLGQYLVFNRKKKIIAIRLKKKTKETVVNHDDPEFTNKVVKYFS